jgi:hypothetical protein
LCAVAILGNIGDQTMLELISEMRALLLIANRQMIALNRPGVWES